MFYFNYEYKSVFVKTIDLCNYTEKGNSVTEYNPIKNFYEDRFFLLVVNLYNNPNICFKMAYFDLILIKIFLYYIFTCILNMEFLFVLCFNVWAGILSRKRIGGFVWSLREICPIPGIRVLNVQIVIFSI